MSPSKIPWRTVPSYLQRRIHFGLRPWRYRLHALAPSLVSISTSQTDRPDYNQLCWQASRNMAVFATFKRQPAYRVVLEHVSKEQGQAYLDEIRKINPAILKYASRVAENDRYGLPYVYDYEIGAFSPTTLRYLKVVADLQHYFGDLSQFNITEIGSAYGGQCVVLGVSIGYRSYTGIDLPAALALMRVYINKHDVSSVRLMTQITAGKLSPPDLLISNYSFSECTKATQDHYLKHILLPAKRGYITYNSAINLSESPAWVPYGVDEIIKILGQRHEIKVLPESPQTGKKSDNLVLIWGDTTP